MCTLGKFCYLAIMSHINYGLLWGTKVYELEHLQKKAVRTIKNNHPLAHSEPL